MCSAVILRVKHSAFKTCLSFSVLVLEGTRGFKLECATAVRKPIDTDKNSNKRKLVFPPIMFEYNPLGKIFFS